MSAPNISPDARVKLEEGLRLSHDPETVEQAADAFESAIQLSPGYALAYFYLGTVYYTWSHYHKAVEPLKKAIELEPDQPAPYYHLGISYSRMGLYSDAEKYLKDFIQLRPDHAEAFFELGFAMLMRFDKEGDAIEQFRQALKLYPRHRRAYYFLGSALVRVKDFEGARQLVDRVKEIYPDQAEHLANLIQLNNP